ncbi:hypothetical protein [Aureivirga sp. CE67]|uniref:hypothetical protein n=1 Tax=Aureivirga sp. CE67 TaxID=1788983 RepID=UPI0018CACC2D|nr:hypothetical protein [Aureivirga sp. CE67]
MNKKLYILLLTMFVLLSCKKEKINNLIQMGIKGKAKSMEVLNLNFQNTPEAYVVPKIVFEFNEKGFITEETEYDDNGVHNRIQYEYDEENNYLGKKILDENLEKIGECISVGNLPNKREEDCTVKNSIYKTSRFLEGNVYTELYLYRNEQEEFEQYKKEIIHFDKKMNMTSKESYGFSDEVDFTNHYQYNSKGIVQKIVIKDKNGKIIEDLDYNCMEVDVEGNCIQYKISDGTEIKYNIEYY